MKKILGFLTIFLSSSVSGQVADSTENFLSEQIAGFLNSLVVTEISTTYDIVMFIIIPFLGMYGITLYLTRKAFQIAEDNFANNDNYGTADLSDQTEKITTLIAAAISAVTVSQFGGMTPGVVLLLALTGVSFFIWQYWGAFQQTRWRGGNNRDTETTSITEEDQVDEAQDRIEREEQEAEQTRDPRTAQRAEAELEKVIQALENEAENIEALEQHEESDTEKFIERMRNLIKHRKRELEALEKYRVLVDRSGIVEDNCFQDVSKDKLQEFEEIFLEFYDDFSGRRSDFQAQWRNSGERNRFLNQNDWNGLHINRLESSFDESDVYEISEELQPVLEEMIEFESGQMQEIQNEKNWLKDELERQREVFQTTRRFLDELERLQEEETSLESIYQHLDGLDPEDVSVDHEKVGELSRHLRKMSGEQQKILELVETIESLEDEEIAMLERISNFEQFRDQARYRWAAWVLIFDLGLQTGTIPSEGQFSDRMGHVTRTMTMFNRYLTGLKKRMDEEISGEQGIEHIVEEMHEIGIQNLQTLSEHHSN